MYKDAVDVIGDPLDKFVGFIHFKKICMCRHGGDRRNK